MVSPLEDQNVLQFYESYYQLGILVPFQHKSHLKLLTCWFPFRVIWDLLRSLWIAFKVTFASPLAFFGLIDSKCVEWCWNASLCPTKIGIFGNQAVACGCPVPLLQGHWAIHLVLLRRHQPDAIWWFVGQRGRNPWKSWTVVDLSLFGQLCCRLLDFQSLQSFSANIILRNL